MPVLQYDAVLVVHIYYQDFHKLEGDFEGKLQYFTLIRAYIEPAHLLPD